MIPLMLNTFYKEKEMKVKLIDFILKTNKLSMDKNVLELENVFSEWQERKYSIMVNSGSSANLILLQALMNLNIIEKNEKIAFSSLTWATNVMPIIQLGCIPIPIDVNLNTINISYETMKDAYIKDKFRCLFITHLLGFSDNLEKICEFCKENNIIIIEDNCESFGSIYKNKKLGNFGLASTFSTFVGHHISTIEGGFVCTDDLNLANMLKMVRSHGWDRNLTHDEQIKLRTTNNITSFYNPYTFYELAYNVRPTEIQGFIGIEQMKYADEICINRNKNYNKILSVSKLNNDCIVISPIDGLFCSNFAIPVICNNLDNFDKLVNRCKSLGIEIRPIVAGDMTQQPFFKKLGYNYTCPNSNKIHKLGFYLPNRPDLTDKEIETLCKVFQ